MLLSLLAPVLAAAFAEPDGAPWPVDEHGAPPTGPLVTVRPALDRDGLLRNPATGWMLYDDASGPVARAEDYWRAQDAAAKHASIFYLRWRWAEAEPLEGRYAWRHDANLRALLQGARDRGLRLAFRFYVASQDNTAQATPEYVRAAGAAGVTEHGAHGPLWTPYLDDPVFQAKFGAFVAAFAQEFDDPARVDFVDALGLGWWGEGHHLTLKDPRHRDAVYRWILDTYSQRFRRVLLGMQYGTEFGWQRDEQWALAGEDYVLRRDGLGSFWFGEHERARFRELWPRVPLFGERCYWGGGEGTPASVAKTDRRFGARFKTWRDLDEAALEDALNYHANTLDLRTIPDAQRFLTYPDLIARFRREGGYRLAPVEVQHPASVVAGDELALRHAWVNLGVGVLPNRNRRWGQRYRPAFALVAAGQTAPGDNLWLSRDAEPADWLRGRVQAYTSRCRVAATTPAGDYTLVCAVLNTQHDGLPDLRLALSAASVGPWYPLGLVRVRG